MDKKSKIKNETPDLEKKGLKEEIIIPEGLKVSISDDFLVVKKDDKEVSRKLNPLINIKIEGNKIVLSSLRSRRIEKRLFGTYRAHVNNMIKGITEGFKFKLIIANVHFPMNVTHDKKNNEIVVKNFLGEKKDRRIKLRDGVGVKIEKDRVELDGYDIEKTGDCATNIEKGTRVRNKDRRIYQDGIFIIEKPGRIYS